MEDKLSRSFGYVIAFLIPGFLGLWALSYPIPDLKRWLGTAETASTSVGSFLFVVVASLGVGVFVSGVRFFTFDKALMPLLKVPGPVPDDQEAGRGDEAKRAAYEDLRDQFYRYYQFYSNTALALLFSFVAWLAAGGRAPVARWVIVLAWLLAELSLVMSARDSITKFRNKKRALLGISSPPTGDRGASDDERGRNQTASAGTKGRAASSAGAAAAAAPTAAPRPSTTTAAEEVKANEAERSRAKSSR